MFDSGRVHMSFPRPFLDTTDIELAYSVLEDKVTLEHTEDREYCGRYAKSYCDTDGIIVPAHKTPRNW